MSSIGEVKRITDDSPKFREVLFARGYLFTDAEIDSNVFPFYGEWQTEKIYEYSLLVHPKAKYYALQTEDSSLVLIGHAYNPFDSLYDENEILRKYADSEDKIGYFNQWTGVFTLIVVKKDGIEVWGDCAGMQCTFYGMLNGKKYVTSHTAIIETICNISTSDYVERLTKYKFYPLFGRQLPGDITPYFGFYRIIPNHMVTMTENVRVLRFFPTAEYKEYSSADEISSAEARIAKLLNKNLYLISQKWEKPAISLTGGCDSKTTMACANGLQDGFGYFSYDSSETETPDADAAASLCHALDLQHKRYYISRNDVDFPNLSEFETIFEFNSGNIGKINANDIRKRIYFYSEDDSDVEVKSWVSECGRAYYSKRFVKEKFPSKPTPHYLTTLYKVFLTDKKLIRETDQIFAKYINRYMSNDYYHYPWQEIFFWEFRMSSWNGLVITGEHRTSYEITIPYNNRVIVDLLLRMPLEYRMNDTAYGAIRKKADSRIDKTGIAVTNVKHTRKRAYLERLYLEVESRI